MRIVAGQFRGRALTSVGAGDAKAHLRPTTDRVRESLFNILGAGKFGLEWSNLAIADIFCGTGAMGLEALSRGAKSAIFIDNGKSALRLVRRNIELLDIQSQSKVVQQDLRRLRSWPYGAIDLLFLDPPYGQGLGITALENLRLAGALAANAVIVFEDNAPAPEIAGFDVLDLRRFGYSHVTFLSPMLQE